MKGFDDVVDFLLLPLELPFQLIENFPKRPPLPHEFLQNSELRNMLPPRPPLPHEIIDQILAKQNNPSKPEVVMAGWERSPSEWRWTMIPTPIEDIPDKDLLWNRDILIDIWKRLNSALRMMDSGIIDRERQVVIIREAHWTSVKYLVDPTDNISTRMRLEKFGRQDILDKLTYAGVRLKRDTVESKVTVPTKPPPYWVAGEKVFEFPLVVRRIVDQSRSMIHDGIRILDKELERRTFPFSSREEILGIMPMEPLPPDYADIRRFGRDLQYAVQATGYDPCYTAQGQKAIQLDLGDRTMGPAKKWADLLTRQGCEVTTFHGHHPIYHVHAICLYPEKQEERDRFLRELMIQIHETFGPPESTWFYDI